MVTDPQQPAFIDAIACVSKTGGVDQTPRGMFQGAFAFEITALAADDVSLYWIYQDWNTSRSTIYRLAK
jgi:hypothetical protein